jgi:Fe-S-cluster-containing hydrogenase component 2
MCEVACSDSHFGAVSPALTRIHVAKLEEIGIDMAVTCVGCEETPCLHCPVDALSVGERRVINLDDGLCDGCEECVDECPVGAIGFHDGLPLFCDLCGGSPLCVDNCPSGALTYEQDLRTSLEPFMQFSGNPAQKRANYTSVAALPLREDWKSGRRVDS